MQRAAGMDGPRRLILRSHAIVPSPSETTSAPRWRRWVRGLGVGLVIALAIGCIWWSATADERALRALPPEQRRALVTHSVQLLRSMCDPAPPRSLRHFCREQARLAAVFAECTDDAGCSTLVRRHIAQPRR
jgi:hypothetical protein